MSLPLKFSDRVKRVKPSFTLEMTSRAAELRAKGVDVINFSVGEPDFNTQIISSGLARKRWTMVLLNILLDPA